MPPGLRAFAEKFISLRRYIVKNFRARSICHVLFFAGENGRWCMGAGEFKNNTSKRPVPQFHDDDLLTLFTQLKPRSVCYARTHARVRSRKRVHNLQRVAADASRKIRAASFNGTFPCVRVRAIFRNTGNRTKVARTSACILAKTLLTRAARHVSYVCPFTFIYMAIHRGT